MTALLEPGAAPHVPVLLAEVLSALSPLEGAVAIDGTFGAGGYSRAMLAAGAGRVIAIDRDPTAIEAGAALVAASAGRLTLVSGTFSELDRLASDGITEQELTQAKGQLAGGTVLALEDPGSRMSRLGRAEMVTGEFQDIDEALDRVNAVTTKQVQELAQELAAKDRVITVVGPFEDEAALGL